MTHAKLLEPRRWAFAAVLACVVTPARSDAAAVVEPTDDTIPTAESELGEPAAGASNVAGIQTSLTTQAEYNQAHYQHLRERGPDVYERTTDDAPALRERAAAWLRSCARADAELGGEPVWKELREQGDTLLEDGCDHPLVVGYVAQLALHSGRATRSRELHERVGEALLAGEYGPLAKMHEAWRWLLTEKLWSDQRRLRDLCSQLQAAFFELAVAEKGSLERQRMLWRDALWIRNQTWRYSNHDLLHQLCGVEAVHPWLRTMATSRLWYDQAWRARGGGFANEVEEDNWKPFHEGIAKAKAGYEEAHALAPDLPEAATALILCVMAEEDTQVEDLRYWFDQAREAQVDHLQAYRNLLWAMRPRWYGSHEQMYALAGEWLDEQRFETNAPYMTAEAVYDIGSEIGGRGRVLESDDAYLLVMSALQQMADHPAHAEASRRTYTRATLLTHQLGAAIVSGRDDDARVVLDAMLAEGLAADDALLSEYTLNRRVHVPRPLARTGQVAERVRALGELTSIEKRASRETLTRTIEAYESAKRATDDPRADAYFDHWTRNYRRERDFFDGEWVEIGFGGDLIDWDTPYRGLWEVEDERTIVSRRSHQSNWSSLWNEGVFSGPIELEVDVETIHETGPETGYGFRVGGVNNEEQHALYFWVNTSARVASASPTAQIEWTEPIPEKKRFRMSVRAWPGYAEMRLDGELVFAREHERFTPDGRFALATLYESQHAAEVRYRNVRVRKLAARDLK